MIYGIILALLSAIGTNLAFMLKHRGASTTVTIDIKQPLKSLGLLMRTKWFKVGLIAEAVAWLLHVGALSLAPLSLTQAVLAGGLVFLGFLGNKLFHYKIT